MFKKKKEEPKQSALHEAVFREIKIDPYKSASCQTLNLATFLLREADEFKHKVLIESDTKEVEIIVSVKTRKTDKDG